MFKSYLKWCVVLSVYAGGAAAATNQPRFIPLDINTADPRISGDGSIVVGTYYDRDHPTGGGGFYWTADSGTVPIGGLGATVISADGMTIVGRANDAMGQENAAAWQGCTNWQVLGSFTPDSLPCDQVLSSAYSVSGDGSVIVGLGRDGCGPAHAHGFRWDAAAGMTDLGSIVATRASRANAISADGSAIVGWSDQATGFRQGARWVDGAWQWFDNEYGPVGEALAVNSDGSKIVGVNCGPLSQWAWYWTEESGVQCVNGPLENPYKTVMLALSNDGQVIGGAVQPEFGPEVDAVLWLNFQPVDLKQYLLDRGVSEVRSWGLSYVNAVSADGSVVAGWGVGPDLFLHAFVVTLPQE